MYKLIGFRRFTGKNGKNFCVATVTSAFNQHDVDNGACGERSQDVFLPDTMIDYLKPADIGKPAHLDYEITGGRAYLIGFSVEGHK